MAYVVIHAVAYAVAYSVAYAVAYEIASTAGYIKLHMIFSEFLRKWETTFWGNERQQQQQNLFLEGFADAALKTLCICMIY